LTVVGWLGLNEAREKLNPAHVPFLDRLAERPRLD
jgi:hypothetical protein